MHITIILWYVLQLEQKQHEKHVITQWSKQEEEREKGNILFH